MRVDFAGFTTTGGDQIIVNPHQVKYIKPYGDEGSLIYFDKDHYVTVTAKPRQVQQALTIDDD